MVQATSIQVPVLLCPACGAPPPTDGQAFLPVPVPTLRAGPGGGLPAGDNLNSWSVHPGFGRQEGPQQAPTGGSYETDRFAVLHHPRDVQVFDAHRLVFTDGSRAEPWRGSNRRSAIVAWAKARLSCAVARLLASFTLRLRLRCSLRIPLKAAQRNGGGAIFTPSRVTVRDAKPGSTPTALPLGGNGSRSTTTMKLATDRPARPLVMVTLLATAGRGRLQGMGMLPTLVSLSLPLSASKALDCNRMLGRLLRRLKRGVRALPLRLPFRRLHQLPRA